MDTIRVLRIIEYTGPRDLIEAQIDRSLHGTKTLNLAGREITIRAATIGGYPEILESGGQAAKRGDGWNHLLEWARWGADPATADQVAKSAHNAGR